MFVAVLIFNIRVTIIARADVLDSDSIVVEIYFSIFVILFAFDVDTFAADIDNAVVGFVVEQSAKFI